MVDANLRILINAVDKASPQLKGITGALQGIMGSVTPYAVVGAAITAVADFTRKAVEETQAYNLEMVDLARKMGTTTEEASRLVQVGDDLRISQASISQAMTFAIRNGIEPSIDGIAQLADKYNALSTPVEKGQLLLKSFGRSGLEMGKLLEKGGQGIKDMAAGMEQGLIVTEEAAEASKQYYIEVDKLNDAWTAFKMNVGNAVIPVLTDLIDGQNDATAATWENVRALEVGIARQKEYGVDTAASVAQIDKMKTALGQAASTARWNALARTFKTDVQPAVEDVIESTTIAVEKMKGAIGGAFGREDASFSAKMQDLKTGAAGLVQGIKDLEGKRWLNPQQKQDLADMRTDLGINQQAITDLAAEHQRATQSMILDLIIQKASMDGFTENEIASVSAIAQQWGLWDEKTAAVISSINANAANLNTDKPKEFARYLDAIFKFPTTKQFNFNVNVDVTQTIMNAYHWQGNP